MNNESRPVTTASLELGVLLAVAGGFQDAYSFIGLGGVFANAQTGNVVLLGIEAARRHWVAPYGTSRPCWRPCSVWWWRRP